MATSRGFVPPVEPTVTVEVERPDGATAWAHGWFLADDDGEGYLDDWTVTVGKDPDGPRIDVTDGEAVQVQGALYDAWRARGDARDEDA